MAPSISRNIKDKYDKLRFINNCPVQFIDDVFESSDFLLQQRKDGNLSKIIESALLLKQGTRSKEKQPEVTTNSD